MFLCDQLDFLLIQVLISLKFTIWLFFFLRTKHINMQKTVFYSAKYLSVIKFFLNVCTVSMLKGNFSRFTCLIILSVVRTVPLETTNSVFKILT